MRSLLVLIARIALALVLLSCGFLLLDVFLGERSPAPVAGLSTKTEGLWTQAPVKVDPARQGFERLKAAPPPSASDLFPLKLVLGRGLRIIDNATFLNGDVTYRVANIPIIDRRRICMDAVGKRYACGLKALKALDNAIRGKRLACRKERISAGVTVVDCMVRDRSLSRMLSAALSGDGLPAWTVERRNE